MAEATIRDVARRAQVSVASVSRALNGLDHVSDETRSRVLTAATALGYVPHAGARSLSLARTHAIGVVLPDLHGEFFSEIVRGMDREARDGGYLLILSNMHDDEQQAQAALRTMRGRVDGLVVMAPHLTEDALRQALPPGLPAVMLNTLAAIEGNPAIRVDNRAGATAVANHLLATGCRNFVHVTGPRDNIDAQERAEAFRAALAAEPAATLYQMDGDFSEEAGTAAANELIRSGRTFDALFAANDNMAIGALQAFRAAGLDVPGDIAVVGFDDIPLARHLALTTVRVRIAELGRRSIQCLLPMLSGGTAEGCSELQSPDLIVRETTRVS